MESENKISLKLRLCYGGMFLLTGLCVFAFSFLTGKSYEAILRNTIVSLIITGTVLFMLIDAISRGEKGFSYDNYKHKDRFIVVYSSFLVLACLFGLVPNQFWPYMSMFVILGLFANMEIGLVSGVGLVTISVMLEESGHFGELFMYVLAGTVALSMFRDLKENTSIGIPVAISLMMQAVLLIAFNVLFQNRTLSFNILILPILNLMLNLIILLIFLNIFGVYIIRKSNDMYMDINDTEYPLLVELKNYNKDDYFKAIHTAYLAERIANGLGFNARAIKNCSYYHRIGILQGKKDWESVKPIYEEHHFPDEAIALLHEYIDPSSSPVRSKEALTINVTETVIASIMYLIKQNKDAKIDYDQLIDKVFEKKEADGELKNCDVTFREYEQMKKILKKEKLYYDFLR
jgi:membrane-associated HD superfamily phosphohydrolase